MTTPTPAPTPAPAPDPVPAGPVSRAEHWIVAHILPSLKQVDGYAEQVVGEAIKLEAALQAVDPALAPQLSAIAAVLRDIAEGLKAL